jgi:outer membrane protein, heavy metal efflux system
MKLPYLRLPLAAALALLAGCASVSRREGADAVAQLLQPRLAGAFAWRNDAQGQAALDARTAELLAAPLTAESAFQLAQLRNPDITTQYAELGIAQADVVAASRIGNPTFSASAMRQDSRHKTGFGLDLPLGELLLLPARKRFAAADYALAQQRIAARLFGLALDTRDDWHAAASAQQVATLREAVAEAAGASAELAQRYHAAGNISALELKLEQAAASQARIAAARARADSLRARLALNTRLGLSGAQADAWTLALPLAGPLQHEDDEQALLSLAHEQNLGLAAARSEVAQMDHVLQLAQRWRLLGTVEVGAERENEIDGARLSGPSLALALPLFDQGQAAIARAQARLEQSRAALAREELQLDNSVRLGVAQVATLRRIAADYRDALVPQREAIVQRQLERHNYMLIGAFELLLAKQQEYDAYQGYIESVRDYWQARSALARAVGTRLPSDTQAAQPVLDIDSVLDPAAGGGEHDGHGGHQGHGGAAPAAAPDPHAAHRMPPLPAPATPQPAQTDAHDGYTPRKEQP